MFAQEIRPFTLPGRSVIARFFLTLAAEERIEFLLGCCDVARDIMNMPLGNDKAGIAEYGGYFKPLVVL